MCDCLTIHVNIPYIILASQSILPLQRPLGAHLLYWLWRKATLFRDKRTCVCVGRNVFASWRMKIGFIRGVGYGLLFISSLSVIFQVTVYKRWRARKYFDFTTFNFHCALCDWDAVSSYQRRFIFFFSSRKYFFNQRIILVPHIFILYIELDIIVKFFMHRSSQG